MAGCCLGGEIDGRMDRATFHRADGTRLATLDRGHGPPVVLVHGYPVSSLLWEGVISVLEDEFRCLALDLPGFGDSDPPASGPLSLSAHAAALGEWLDALALAPVHLVVHDLGGPVGLLWALDHPERVRRITVLNTFTSARFRAIDELLLGALRTPLLREVARTRLALRTVLRLGFERPETVTDELLDRIAGRWTGARADLPIRGFVDAFGAPGRPELARVEREVGALAPLMAIGLADADPFCAAYTRRLMAQLPSVPVQIFPGAAHFFPLERAEVVAAWLRTRSGITDR